MHSYQYLSKNIKYLEYAGEKYRYDTFAKRVTLVPPMGSFTLFNPIAVVFLRENIGSGIGVKLVFYASQWDHATYTLSLKKHFTP